MKNIIVVLMMLLAAQILVADAQYVNPDLNDLNDWSSLGYSILPYFLPTCSISEEDIRCVNDVEPEKSKVTEKPIRVKYTYPEICIFPGACGEVDYKKNIFPDN